MRNLEMFHNPPRQMSRPTSALNHHHVGGAPRAANIPVYARVMHMLGLSGSRSAPKELPKNDVKPTVARPFGEWCAPSNNNNNDNHLGTPDGGVL